MVAIDPGAQGAIIFDTQSGLEVVRMPMMYRGKKRVLDADAFFECIMAARGNGNLICALEDVGVHMAGNNAQSSATFAYTCGMTYGILSACGVGVKLIPPKQWQAWLGIKPGGVKEDRKRAIKAEVQRRFPHIKVINDTADALGIYAFVTGNL
jgi:hypothetical protein